jgi:clan AA aspartic protease
VGHVYIDATFSGPSGSVTVRRALVDTGATLTVIPPKLLEQVGGKPLYRQPVHIAGGKTIEADIASLLVSINGRAGPAHVVVLEGQDVVAIGVETLEVLGLRVDPTAKPPRLEPTRPFTLLAL